MKILIIGPHKSPIIQRLVNSLRARGHAVWLASHDCDNNDKLINLGSISSFVDYLFFSKINKIVKKINPDIVHAHVLNHYGLMAIAQPKPLVVALWGSDVMLAPKQGNFLKKNIFRLINKVVLWRASRCHTSGRHVAEEANKQYRRTLEKTKVFYWGFSLEKPDEGKQQEISVNIRRDFGIEKDGKYVVFPRGLGAVYNPNLVAKIINRLKLKIDSIKQIVVLKGFSTLENEANFKKLVDLKELTYIDRLLNSDELYYLYERAIVHVSVPISDSLGGGVVEPALLGSFPVLSKLPSYSDYALENPAHIINSSSDYDIDKAVEVISLKLKTLEKNLAPVSYSNDNVMRELEHLYADAIMSKTSR